MIIHYLIAIILFRLASKGIGEYMTELFRLTWTYQDGKWVRS